MLMASTSLGPQVTWVFEVGGEVLIILKFDYPLLWQ